MTAVLISSEKISTTITGAEAYRVRYRSRDVQGKATQSTGLVIAPASAGENRRVMSWAHGTTGMGDASCPSAQHDPARELTLYFAAGSTTQIDYGIPGVQAYLDDGWIVAATDYQGMGTDGVHQYTVNRTNARDTVNIVHAVREMNLGAGTQFGVVGWSQGGGTAGAAAELDPEDYGDLTLVGAVAMSPGVPITAVQQPGLGGSLSGDAPIPPDGHLFMILCGMVAAFPETLSLDDVLTPAGRNVYEQSWNTAPVHHLTDILGRTFKYEGPVMAVNKAKFPAWLEAFKAGSATLSKPICPILVLIDKQDPNGPCPLPWQLAYIDDVQKLGGEISSLEYPNDDHFSLPQASMGDARTWLATKFTN